MTECDNLRMANEKMENAKTMALYSIIQDLAANAGVSDESFLMHYKTRFRWWHDYYLRQIEDTNPSLAGTLDTRALDQVFVDQSYPSIFDSPPSNEA